MDRGPVHGQEHVIRLVSCMRPARCRLTPFRRNERDLGGAQGPGWLRTHGPGWASHPKEDNVVKQRTGWPDDRVSVDKRKDIFRMKFQFRLRAQEREYGLPLWRSLKQDGRRPPRAHTGILFLLAGVHHSLVPPAFGLPNFLSPARTISSLFFAQRAMRSCDSGPQVLHNIGERKVPDVKCS